MKYITIILILGLLLLAGCIEQPIEDSDTLVNQHCKEGDTVYMCGEYVKIVNDLPGAGSKFISKDKIIECPVVAPDMMSSKCKNLLLSDICDEKPIC